MSKKQPEFVLQFNCFAQFGDRIEASFIVSPEFELKTVSDIRHDKGTIRALNLVFYRTNSTEVGRRVFSLKKEFEQTPDGLITLDSAVDGGKT